MDDEIDEPYVSEDILYLILSNLDDDQIEKLADEQKSHMMSRVSNDILVTNFNRKYNMNLPKTRTMRKLLELPYGNRWYITNIILNLDDEYIENMKILSDEILHVFSTALYSDRFIAQNPQYLDFSLNLFLYINEIVYLLKYYISRDPDDDDYHSPHSRFMDGIMSPGRRHIYQYGVDLDNEQRNDIIYAYYDMVECGMNVLKFIDGLTYMCVYLSKYFKLDIKYRLRIQEPRKRDIRYHSGSRNDKQIIYPINKQFNTYIALYIINMYNPTLIPDLKYRSNFYYEGETMHGSYGRMIENIILPNKLEAHKKLLNIDDDDIPILNVQYGW